MKAKITLLGALILSVINFNAQVLPSIDWVNYKSDRSQISNVPSAIDANNNAFITGYMFVSPTNANANTVKYDPNGVELWTNSYDNGGFDNSKAIVIDAAGNSYITGESDGIGTGRDIITIKISPAGVQLWAMRFNGVANSNDVGNSIVVDPSGDVFVTGYTTNMSGNRDYVTLKYNSSGVLQFSVFYAGAGNQNDEAVAIGLNGNRLYITGTSVNGSGNSDLVTIRINTNNGNTMWSKSENGTANSNDIAYALIPYNNDVVVVGQVNNTTTNNDYITSRYNGNNGNTVWSNVYDFVNTNGGATALTVDATGNFAVTGIVNNTGVYEYHTVLYNNSGVQQWVNKVSTNLPYSNAMPQIDVDPIANHFYVCGQKSGVGSDIFVYQITPGGNKSWEETYNGTQNGPDAAVDLVVNATGVLYVAGASLNSNAKYDYTTIKITQTPVYFPIDFNNVNEPYSVSHLFYPNLGQIVDSNKVKTPEVLFYTRFDSPAEFILSDRVAFVEYINDSTKVNPRDSVSRVDMVFVGTKEFAKVYPFEFKANGKLNYFVNSTDSNGVTDIAGASRLMIPEIYRMIDLHYYSNSGGCKYYFVVKPGGNPADIKLAFNNAVSTGLVGTSLKINSPFSSWSFKTPKIYNVTIALNTPSVTGSTGWVNTGVNTYSIDPGTYNASLPLVIEFDKGMLIAPPTNSLNCQWSTYVGGSGIDVPTQIKSDAANNLFTCGWTNSFDFPPAGLSVYQSTLAGFRDGYIDKYDVNGARIWSTYIGGNQDDYLWDFSIAPSTDIYLVGITQSTLLTFGKAGATNYLTPLGSDDIFIFQLTGDGKFKNWLTYYGGNNTELRVKCEFDPLGNFFVVGETYSKNIPIVGTSPQYTNTNNDVGTSTNGFIAKYNASSLINWATYLGTSVNGTVTAQADGLLDLHFDSSNDLYVCGWANGVDFPNTVLGNSFNAPHVTGIINDGTIARFSNTGQIKWSTCIGGSQNNALGVIKAKNNKVYVGGFKTPGSQVLYPYKNSGNWYYCKDTTSGASDGMFAIFKGTNDSLLHYSGIKDTLFTSLEDLEVDNADIIFLSGTATNSVWPTPLTQPVGVYVDNFKGVEDYFIYAIAPGTTSLVWATNIGGTSSDGAGLFPGGTLIDINPLNMLHISGNTQSPVNFPLFTGTVGITYFDGSQNGQIDASITRFYLGPVNFVGIKESAKKIADLSIYPNPTQSIINIRLIDKNEKTTYIIYNTLGQIVKQGVLSRDNEINSLDVSNLTHGLYIIDLIQKSERTSAKFIKHD